MDTTPHRPDAVLHTLGLSEGEAEVYRLLLRAGEASVGDISRGCAFSRARIYGILDNLVARGAAHQVSVHPRTYAPENPRRLAEMRLHEVEAACAAAEETLIPLYETQERSYTESVTVRDMGVFQQVEEMCLRATESLDGIAAFLPSAIPDSLCRAFASASHAGVRVRLLFPLGEAPLDLARLPGKYEIRRAATPAAGMFIIDQAELLIGGLEKPESTAHLLGLWLHHEELARLSGQIFETLFEAGEPL
ncbi:MAG: helix-turn-helix domain-containing protein [Candidatus Poseidoniia archaeon]|nr:helix-turn-helix domain-containing protein [Candidatus Poseidoniia archaeon]MDP7135661.1 helix-turn-helix domain-containing protein [Candidatus Poseidoniia archaeon]MDP7535181.1 helix-turn-helix domain-containing protein [Candidatus Poseidoniia archaeon]MDP7590028.1 helix-turn-helix domain-containing protein [Candidatus Poseidoniia archaeon]MDP7607056.1 helix-turn-helix domain-containing protein [Candidatus Poseidoniia archaeon]